MRILISCNSQDIKLAGVLRKALSSHFPIPFLYNHDTEFGEDFVKRIEKEINSCDALLVVITPNSISAPWVAWEIQHTLDIENATGTEKIIPILMKGDYLHPLLPYRVHADFRTDYLIKRNYPILVERLLKLKPFYGKYKPIEQRINMEKLIQDVFREPDTHVLKSPMIGTIFRKRSYEKPNLIEIGDNVKTGQPVCIIEAMKLFNEIESEVDGKVIKILFEDSYPIEYDQPLVLIELHAKYKSIEEYLI
jgi:biotin carboxyl carrier protein